MADRYAPTKTQKKESKKAGAVIGGVYGAWGGAAAGAGAYGRPSRPASQGRYFVDFGREASGAHKWQEAAKKKTSERPNPKFNTKRWEKVDNLYQRAQGGEKAAAGAAKERMLAAGEGPYLKGSKNPFLRAAAHKHSPKVMAGAIGAATAGVVGTGLYHGTKKLAEHGYRQENKIAAERKSAMSKSAFGADHEVAKKYWNPTTKTRRENVKHGAKKGAKVGAVIDSAFGAARGAAVMGPRGAALGAVGGAVEGAAIGGGIGATHGALRPNKLSKGMELKPLVLNSNGELVGNVQGNGDQRDPKPGPFGVPKGPMVQTKERASGGGGEKSTMPKKSGHQGSGAGKRHTNMVSKAFEPLPDEDLNEILKGFGMGGFKSAGNAVRGFAQYHGAGAANKINDGFKAAKPKMKSGLKLAAANPGKTASVTAGVGAGAGFGMGRKTR